MKLIIAILRDADTDLVTRALTAGKVRVTRIASTGGLLHRGVTTLLAGVDDDMVESTIQIMKENCSSVVEGEKRATVFVVPVEKFVQL